MNTLLLGEGCHQGKGSAHNRSWANYANAFSICRQFRRHLPIRELVRGPYGHHQTYLGRQCRRALTILKENSRSWDIMLDEGADNRSVVNRYPCTLSRFMSALQHQQLNHGSNKEHEREKRYTAAKKICRGGVVPSVPA